ncbi:hypothetical protein KCU70_g222, partial [Aureobasidium melanogenum]
MSVRRKATPLAIPSNDPRTPNACEKKKKKKIRNKSSHWGDRKQRNPLSPSYTHTAYSLSSLNVSSSSSSSSKSSSSLSSSSSSRTYLALGLAAAALLEGLAAAGAAGDVSSSSSLRISLARSSSSSSLSRAVFLRDAVDALAVGLLAATAAALDCLAAYAFAAGESVFAGATAGFFAFAAVEAVGFVAVLEIVLRGWGLRVERRTLSSSMFASSSSENILDGLLCGSTPSTRSSNISTSSSPESDSMTGFFLGAGLAAGFAVAFTAGLTSSSSSVSREVLTLLAGALATGSDTISMSSSESSSLVIFLFTSGLVISEGGMRPALTAGGCSTGCCSMPSTTGNTPGGLLAAGLVRKLSSRLVAPFDTLDLAAGAVLEAAVDLAAVFGFLETTKSSSSSSDRACENSSKSLVQRSLGASLIRASTSTSLSPICLSNFSTRSWVRDQMAIPRR